ncbi:protein patched homolog 2-like [Portunus trituberculatus]|uniref:protein patched homolog 2-like n=1 Tax=Portunus trituberculatus TaxID=210409 RepID=UPI001E1CC403|nr:protein patched homolog 2-like [Portunus trituberculatus]
MGKSNNENCLKKASNAISNGLQTVFFRYGRSIATYPWIYIVVCVVATAACCVGLMNFYSETRAEKLWIPQDSDYVKTLKWQSENFPNNQRAELILYEADNVLKAEYIQEMYRIRKELREVVVTDKYGRSLSQEDLCYKVPVLATYEFQEAVGQDFEGDMDSLPEVQAAPEMGCYELNLLDVWQDNETIILDLTDEDVVRDVNAANTSATLGFPMDFIGLLGGVQMNDKGLVVEARSALTTILMEVNRTEVDMGDVGTGEGLSEDVDLELYEWEAQFIRVVGNDTERPEGLNVYLQSARSYGEISGDTIVGDVFYLAVGMLLLFVYVQVMLGKFNLVETRPVLSLLGLVSVGMAVGVSFGLCSAFNVPYGPVHSVLPLLMLGLGVDDMFVIVQCWNNLNVAERRKEMKERVGLALRHAGVAITITSLTDFVAFAIGASTVLPALQSFCIYCAVGIIALYVFQATFFVAWFTLDQTRMEKHRNGLLWCYTHKHWTPNACSQKDLCQMFFSEIYSKYLLMKPVKVLVLAVTAAVLGTCIWGVTNLRQEFNPVWFIPESSYLYQFISKVQYYYPESGEKGLVYLGNLDYAAELPSISLLEDKMRKSQYISSVDSWYDGLVSYTLDTTGENITGMAVNASFFEEMLTGFLFSGEGGRFQQYFKFENDSIFPEAIVLASKFGYQHIILNTSSQRITAMDQMKSFVDSANFSGFAASIAAEYSNWETDKIIAEELIRNLALAMAAVFVMTLLLLASFISSIYVLLCVVLTLVDVMALMTWWGLTIDTVSCINLVLCIGLCVDYSVHIALHFLQIKGSRDERVRVTVKEMGPPVLNGAFSTFLTFILLAGSESHVFESFFKIFFGVFMFGVFHGLVFLPVLLSLIGPAPYNTSSVAAMGSENISSEKELVINGHSYTQHM